MPSRETMPPALTVEYLASSDGFQGPIQAAQDVLTTLRTLALMRDNQSRKAGRLTPEIVCKPWSGQSRRAAPDVFLLPGWMAHNGPHLDELVISAPGLPERLRQVAEAGGRTVAIGNAAAALGYAGLLQDGQAVCPWTFFPSFQRLSGGLRLRHDVLWTSHQQVWTCTSPVLTTEVFLDALRSTALAELAAAAALVLLPNLQRQQAVQQMAQEQATKSQAAGSVERARRWLDAHLTEPYDMARLSAMAATSPRTLLRHFEATHGMSPLRYLQQQRMTRAKVLLETTYSSIEQVAQACGYTDTGSFRRVFQKITGDLPAQYREQYRLRTSRQRWRQGAATG